MLDSQAWNRLIQGLVRATDEGTIVWKEAKYAAGYGGVTALRKSALSPLIDQRVLRASSKSVTYELTADSFGRAPYELAVWEEVNDRKTPMGLTGFLAIDPLLGMVFGVVLLWASWTIIRSALRILLQGTPEHLDLPAAIASLEEIDEVEDVHHVHAWTITSGRTVFSAHLHVANPAQHEAVLEQATDLLTDRFDIYFSTLQIERTCPAEAATSIDITRPPRARDRPGHLKV